VELVYARQGERERKERKGRRGEEKGERRKGVEESSTMKLHQ
jgi:hypothetical protein